MPTYKEVSDRQVIELQNRLMSQPSTPAMAFPHQKPHLAHYTTLSTLENILRNDEIWFSHPSGMNDHQEVIGGIQDAWNLVPASEEIREACMNEKRLAKFNAAFAHKLTAFMHGDFRETYIFSTSFIATDDTHGSLSMWRAYGGDGSGVALVFDTSALNFDEGSPFIMAPVTYDLQEHRLERIAGLCALMATYIWDLQPNDESLLRMGEALAEVMKFGALFSKHKGFEEENEWRVVYVRARDVGMQYDSFLSYDNGPRGLEPKLKFKVGAKIRANTNQQSLERLIHKVIIGPSRATDLVGETARRMIRQCGKPDLARRVVESRIPYRPTRR